LDQTASDGSFQIDNFSLNRLDRNSNGGGIITYCNVNLNPVNLDVVQQKYKELGLEVTFTRITLSKSSKSFVILGIYRPPSSNKSWFELMNDALMEVAGIGPIFLLGDLNADLNNMNIYPAKQLLQTLSLANSSVRDIFSTRFHENGGSCLDIIAIPKDIDCLVYKLGSLSISDHFPVETIIKVQVDFKLIPIV